jgi:hypothetical protein
MMENWEELQKLRSLDVDLALGFIHPKLQD